MTEELFDEFSDGFTDELSEDSEGGVAVAVAEPKAAAAAEEEKNTAAAIQEEQMNAAEAVQEEIIQEEKAEEDKKEEKEVRFDIDLDTGMEWEVETVPPEEPKRVYRPSYEHRHRQRRYDRPSYDHRYRQGRYDRPSYDYRYRQSRYDTGNRNGEVPVARRLNKHLFTWLFSFYLGMFGVDRFVRGQVGLGILKLITFGGFGVWYTLDWVIALIKSYGPGSGYGNDLEFDYSGRYID